MLLNHWSYTSKKNTVANTHVFSNICLETVVIPMCITTWSFNVRVRAHAHNLFNYYSCIHFELSYIGFGWYGGALNINGLVCQRNHQLATDQPRNSPPDGRTPLN